MAALVFGDVGGCCCWVFVVRVVSVQALGDGGWWRETLVGEPGDGLVHLCEVTTGLCVGFGCCVGGDGPCFG